VTGVQTCALPILAVRVDHHTHRRGTVGEHDSLCEVLHGVDCLPMATDEQTNVLAPQTAPQHTIALLHLDLHVEAQSVRDLLEQLFERLRRLQLLGVGIPLRNVDVALVAHRRLPERFFFLRGERGGATLVPPPTPATASAGSRAPLARPLEDSGDFGGFGGAGPIRRRMKYCWAIVHTLVVIQYTSNP